MKCEACHENEATVHLTKVDHGVVKKVHLCETCAEEKGIDVENPIALTDLLFKLSSGGTSQKVGSTKTACPECGLKREQFQERGRLGCASCYEAFQDDLFAFVKAVHHSTQHVGKVPSQFESAHSPMVEISALKKELNNAVARENYEKAAELRDQILELQEGTEAKKESAGPDSE